MKKRQQRPAKSKIKGQEAAEQHGASATSKRIEAERLAAEPVVGPVVVR